MNSELAFSIFVLGPTKALGEVQLCQFVPRKESHEGIREAPQFGYPKSPVATALLVQSSVSAALEQIHSSGNFSTCCR